MPAPRPARYVPRRPGMPGCRPPLPARGAGPRGPALPAGACTWKRLRRGASDAAAVRALRRGQQQGPARSLARAQVAKYRNAAMERRNVVVLGGDALVLWRLPRPPLHLSLLPTAPRPCRRPRMVRCRQPGCRRSVRRPRAFRRRRIDQPHQLAAAWIPTVPHTRAPSPPSAPVRRGDPARCLRDHRVVLARALSRRPRQRAARACGRGSQLRLSTCTHREPEPEPAADRATAVARRSRAAAPAPARDGSPRPASCAPPAAPTAAGPAAGGGVAGAGRARRRRSRRRRTQEVDDPRLHARRQRPGLRRHGEPGGEAPAAAAHAPAPSRPPRPSPTHTNTHLTGPPRPASPPAANVARLPGRGQPPRPVCLCGPRAGQLQVQRQAGQRAALHCLDQRQGAAAAAGWVGRRRGHAGPLGRLGCATRCAPGAGAGAVGPAPPWPAQRWRLLRAPCRRDAPPAFGALTLRPGPPHAGGGWRQTADYGEVNSASSAQVASFISNALKRFPPAPDRNYMLVFWDHGSGWEGFGGRRCAAARLCTLAGRAHVRHPCWRRAAHARLQLRAGR
jgi:hypothetical protein